MGARAVGTMPGRMSGTDRGRLQEHVREHDAPESGKGDLMVDRNCVLPVCFLRKLREVCDISVRIERM